MSDLNNAFDESIEQVIKKVIFDTKIKVKESCEKIKNKAETNYLIKEGEKIDIITEIKINNEEIIGYITCKQEESSYIHQGTGIYVKDENGKTIPWKSKESKDNKKQGRKANLFLEEARDESSQEIEVILKGEL